MLIHSTIPMMCVPYHLNLLFHCVLRHASEILAGGDRELTMGMIIRLSKKFASPDELETLAVIGLNMNEDIVAGIMRNQSSDIHLAAKEVFKAWRASQENHQVAYTNMCAALRNRHVQLNGYIHEVLMD